MKFIQDLKRATRETLPYFIIGSVVLLGWQGLEYWLEGEITPRTTDSIIAIVLTCSLWGNYLWLKEKYSRYKKRQEVAR